jgi:hypothetical protein
MATRRIERGQRSWVVRSYRFRWPPWRSFWPDTELDDPLGDLSVLAFFLNLLLAPFTLFIIPLLVYPLETAVHSLNALVTPVRWVNAAAEGEPRIQMTWITDEEHEEAVVDQVARQLELGYSKIEPYRAHFLGFA